MLKAKDSSRIENIVTTSDQIFQMLNGLIRPLKRLLSIVRRCMSDLSY
ncbi:hypothetical protein [Candidatus Williamhamiltonella defendens]|nr:hypothetical protein [Candidatus Hamiltonella defensa]